MADIFRQVTTISLLGGAEVASFGWWIFDPVGGAPENVQADINAIPVHWWDSVKDQYANTTSFASNVLQLYNDDVTPAVLSLTLPLLGPISNAGTNTDTAVPPQCAIVVGLRTGTAGASARGRFYLPGTATNTVSTGGRIKPATVTDLLNGLGAYFQAINAGGYNVGVFSQTTHGFTPSPYIELGDVWDTQRRRRDTLVESRSTISI